MTAATTTPRAEMPSLNRFKPVAGVVILGLILAMPFIGLDAYWTREIILVAILALVTSGLNVSLGCAGELAVGQVALYAGGAWGAGYVEVSHNQADILVGLV